MKRRKAGYLISVSVAVVGFLAAWAIWWEPASTTVVRRTVAIQPWHAEHAGLKVALLSDLHVGAPFRDLSKLKEVVARTNAEKPDLVLILGDFVIQGVVGGHFVPPDLIAEELTGLRAPMGSFAVLGNHDWAYDGRRVRSALESRGITVLDDQSKRVVYKERAFWLSGLADFWTRGSHVAQTLATIDTDDPILVLMHNPDVFPEIPSRVSLTLAGHTHGGQVNLPLLGRLIVPSRFKERFAYGLVEEEGRKLFVTAGLGTSILPVRFRVPPEIVILTLTSE